MQHCDTVGYRYNAVQYIMIFYTVLQWLMWNINQTSYSQKTPHTSPSQVSYWMSIVKILENIDRIITAPHCITITDCAITIILQLSYIGVSMSIQTPSYNTNYRRSFIQTEIKLELILNQENVSLIWFPFMSKSIRILIETLHLVQTDTQQ